jgi:hypothetical protein
MSPPVDPVVCSDVLHRIEAWIDGDLEAGEATTIEAHVEGCAFALEIRSRLHAMSELDPPNRVLSAVRDATAPSVGERARGLMDAVILRPAPAIATLAVVVVVMLAVLPARESGTPQYTDKEVARAAEETKLALAYVSSVTRRAESQVRRKVLEDGAVAATVHRISRSMDWTGTVAGAEPTTTVLPKEEHEGSS